jgi:hypothetical protein
MLGPGGFVERLVVGGVPYDLLLREMANAALRIARVHGDAHYPAADVFFALGAALHADVDVSRSPALRAYCEAATRWTYDDGGLSRADPSGATTSGGSHVHGG